MTGVGWWSRACSRHLVPHVTDVASDTLSSDAGTKTEKYLDANVQAASLELSSEECQQLEAAASLVSFGPSAHATQWGTPSFWRFVKGGWRRSASPKACDSFVRHRDSHDAVRHCLARHVADKGGSVDLLLQHVKSELRGG